MIIIVNEVEIVCTDKYLFGTGNNNEVRRDAGGLRRSKRTSLGERKVMELDKPDIVGLTGVLIRHSPCHNQAKSMVLTQSDLCSFCEESEESTSLECPAVSEQQITHVVKEIESLMRGKWISKTK